MTERDPFAEFAAEKLFLITEKRSCLQWYCIHAIMLAMVLHFGGKHLQQCISVRVLSKTACCETRFELQPRLCSLWLHESNAQAVSRF